LGNNVPFSIRGGCEKYPPFSVCTLKEVIGDYNKKVVTGTSPQADEPNP